MCLNQNNEKKLNILQFVTFDQNCHYVSHALPNISIAENLIHLKAALSDFTVRFLPKSVFSFLSKSVFSLDNEKDIVKP